MISFMFNYVVYRSFLFLHEIQVVLSFKSEEFPEVFLVF